MLRMEYIPKQFVKLTQLTKEVERLKATLDYIAMMSDIELEEEEGRNVEEVSEG